MDKHIILPQLVRSLYSNMYSATTGDFPSQHQHIMVCFVHAHSPGKGYFAHAGNWIAVIR